MGALDANGEKKATANKGFRLGQNQTGGAGPGQQPAKQECGGAPSSRREAGSAWRRFAKGLGGRVPGSECTSVYYLWALKQVTSLGESPRLIIIVTHASTRSCGLDLNGRISKSQRSSGP